MRYSGVENWLDLPVSFAFYWWHQPVGSKRNPSQNARSARRRATSGRCHRLARGGHYILGFPAYPDRDIRAGLTARGILVLQYVPDSALMVSVPRGASLEGLNLTFAVAMEAGDKIDPGLAASSTNAYLVIFHADIAPARTRESRAASGFDVIDHPSLLPNQLVAIGSFDRLRGLAANDEVQYIMPASADLIAGAPLVACPGGITEAGPIGEYVLVGRGWSKDASGVAALQYFVQNVTEKAEANSAHAGDRAGASRVDQIRKYHADAHRAAPTRFARSRSASRAGRTAMSMHSMAPAKSWRTHSTPPRRTANRPPATCTWMPMRTGRSAAALISSRWCCMKWDTPSALGHSTQPGAVMYPYYRMATGLAADDIAGIQDLYGAPAAPSQAPPTPAGPPLQPPTTPAGPPATPTGPTAPTEPPLQPPTTPALPPTTPSEPAGPTQPPLLPPTDARPAAEPRPFSRRLRRRFSLPAHAASYSPQPRPPRPVPPRPVPPPRPPSPRPRLRSRQTPRPRRKTPRRHPCGSPAREQPSFRHPSATISMSGTASDAVGVASVKWTTSAGTTGTASGTTAWSVNIPLLVGTNVISIRAFDAAGNSSWRAVTVVRR